ncbi:MAG: SUMF1/EgtB/PvdO family nonheme iron enzyme, partial [Gammaproteobacteria bacterium]|nr:SUMF1/EgtB/PvdO family nonheme iron enzyme [Gammaproteobacteria bacterium]
AEAFVDDTHDQYNYPAAFDEIAKASSYFPDSAELLQERASLETRRANLLSSLTTKFNQSLADDQIMPGKQGSITDIIKTLKIADPNNSLLHDERLINRYAQLVQKDVTAKNYAEANSVLVVGLDYAPDDPELLNLQDQIQGSLKEQQDGPRISQLEKLLQPSVSNAHSLEDFAKIRPYMLELAKLNPADPILAQLDSSLMHAMQAALHYDTTAKNWGSMEKSLTVYSHLLAIGDLVTLRTALTQAETHAGFTSPDTRSTQAKADSNRSAIKKILASPKYDSDWDLRLLNLTQDTAALLQTEDMQWFKEIRESIAKAYINLANAMIKQNRFLAASDLLATGREYAPQLPGFAHADQALADAQQNFKQEQTERLRMAQIIALENQFQTQLNAGQISDARKTYLNLQNRLPVNDKFLTQVAPQAYAGAYLNLANARAAIGDYHGAIALVQGGLQYAPLDSLKKALQDYSAKAERNDLMSMAVNIQPQGMDALKTKLASVQKLFPGEPLQIADELYRNIAAHIVALKTTDLVLANALLVAAKSAFPQSVVIRNTVLPPAPVISKYAKLGRTAMALNELSKAEGDLAIGQETEPNNQDLDQFATQLQTAQANANRYFVAYQEYMRAGQSQQAKIYLAEAMRLWVDNPAFQAEYQRNFANNQAQVISPNGGQPCTVELAGYGRQGRADCYDFLGKGLQGPIMVVVPAGGGFKQPFAIGKYEISVGQINAYCRATGQCKPLNGENNMPATDIPFTDARNYVAWLSKRSSERYFIPSYIQYRYAASAGGTDTNQDFNCQVTLAGQVIKGLSMVNIETGRPNIWGLVNYVGNAQEWVLGSDGLEAVGGDYRDPLSQCGVDLVRPSNGSADPLTGFRVGRYLDK